MSWNESLSRERSGETDKIDRARPRTNRDYDRVKFFFSLSVVFKSIFAHFPKVDRGSERERGTVKRGNGRRFVSGSSIFHFFFSSGCESGPLSPFSLTPLPLSRSILDDGNDDGDGE